MIKFKTKGNMHYVTLQVADRFYTAVFDHLSYAWRFAAKLRKELLAK